MPKIAILLPTFNGEKYLAAQLDSILQQNKQNFVMVMRDDCSTDRSRQILEQYSHTHPKLVHLLAADGKNLGASGSFSFLIEYTLANKSLLGLDPAYLMFCDQDDIWHPDKLKLELEKMHLIESQWGQETPVLIHSDLSVVSESGALVAKSLLQYQALNPYKTKLGQLLISNTVTGCTALINEALARKSLPIASQAVMHDWWLALVAASFGKLDYIPQQLVSYRQHANNTIGAKLHTNQKILDKSVFRKIFDNKPVPLLHDVANQANAFLQQYKADLSVWQLIALRLASGLKSDSGFLQRCYFRTLRLL